MITDKLDENSPETKAEAAKAAKTSAIVGAVLGLGVWWLCSWHILGFVAGLVVYAMAFFVMLMAQAPIVSKNDQVRRERDMLAELKRANDLAEQANKIAERNISNSAS